MGTGKRALELMGNSTGLVSQDGRGSHLTGERGLAPLTERATKRNKGRKERDKHLLVYY